MSVERQRRSPGRQRSARGGAERVFRTLLNAGFECYLVGGSVRDRLLGRPGADLDFTTNARPETILKLFRNSHYPNRFGTVLVLDDGAQYEVTTYRGEGRYSDHRHPDQVAFVDRLDDDLERRDFTINAMAMDAAGRIIDPFGGRSDLRDRNIRAVGDAQERLAEDPLRMMRAARLAAQLSFSIEERTWRAIVQNAGLLAKISRERVRDELLKLLASDHPVTGLDFVDHLGLLPEVLPELAALQRINRPPEEEFGLYQHALRSLRFCSGDSLARLTALLHTLNEADSDEGAIARALDQLRLSNAQGERVLRLAGALTAISEDLPADERSVRRLLSEFGNRLPELLSLVEAHRRALARCSEAAGIEQLRAIALLAETIDSEGQPLTLSDLAVNGSDLMRELGLAQGKAVGHLLKSLLDRVLDDPTLNRQEALIEIAAVEVTALGESRGPND